MTAVLEIILWKSGGPRYRTRDGRFAVVTESNGDDRGAFYQGWVEGGYPAEWNPDGTHRGGGSCWDLMGPIISDRHSTNGRQLSSVSNSESGSSS